MKDKGTPVVSMDIYRKLGSDPNRLAKYLEAEQVFHRASEELRAEGEAEAIDDSAVAMAMADHPSNHGHAAPSRGPWVLEVTGLGRPLTFNTERTSSMSKGTWAKVRNHERAWSEAVARQASLAGIPPLERAFTVIQTFYPSRVVPDPDGTPASVKAALDGLVAAGILPDDRREQLAFGFHVLPPVTDGGEFRLTLTVYPLP